MGEIPHLKELVQLHTEDPFTILGVNTDSDLDEYHTKAADHEISWRSAWNPNPSSGLPQVFGVTGYPTMILLDAEGRALWMGHFPGSDPSFTELLEGALDEAREAGEAMGG